VYFLYNPFFFVKKHHHSTHRCCYSDPSSAPGGFSPVHAEAKALLEKFYGSSLLAKSVWLSLGRLRMLATADLMASRE
jgi:hypothetical protein